MSFSDYVEKKRSERQAEANGETSGAVQLAACKCRSAWCESVFCRKAAVTRLFEGGRTGTPENWDWQHVRHVVLTVDPDNFEDGQAAYEETKDRVSYMIQRIRRKTPEFHRVIDYIKLLEWHRNGFPHWHFLILTSCKGKKAMIGGELLREAWGYGFVFEGYPESKKHWLNTVGYGAKAGYCGGSKGGLKDHQVTLPEWALDRKSGTIRKGSRRQATGDPLEVEEESAETDAETETGDDGDEDPTEDERPERRSYRALLTACGASSRFVSLDNPRHVYDLPFSAEEIREILLPGLESRGIVKGYEWVELCTEKRGGQRAFVISFSLPRKFCSDPMRYLWEQLVRELERQSGMKSPGTVKLEELRHAAAVERAPTFREAG